VVEGDFPEFLDAEGFLLPDETCEVRKRRRFLLRKAVDAASLPAAAEASRTRFRRLARNAGLSLLEAELDTGRTHQIRATLCSLGYPVVGDKLYGPDPRLFLRFAKDQLTPADRARLRLPRQALHAYRLAFPHPVDRRPLDLIAPLPGLMAEFCTTNFPDIIGVDGGMR
jgi:23S rRNA-/tRNA-specific pseudouridylate synthase